MFTFTFDLNHIQLRGIPHRQRPFSETTQFCFLVKVSQEDLISGAVIEIRSGSAHEEGGHGLPALLREQPRSCPHARSVTHFLKCNTQTRIQCQPAIKGGGGRV